MYILSNVELVIDNIQILKPITILHTFAMFKLGFIVKPPYELV